MLSRHFQHISLRQNILPAISHFRHFPLFCFINRPSAFGISRHHIMPWAAGSK
jgi:hypothetical protein